MRTKNFDFAKPLTIVCLGDSITCNWNEPSYIDFWQELLQKKFKNTQIKVVNAGINGETVQDGYYRVKSDVLPHRPDLVTVMFGHNDITYGISPELYRKYLKNIVGLIKHNSNAEVWLLTPNKVGDEKEDEKYLPYIEMLEDAAGQKGAEVVDIRKAFEKVNLDEIYTFEFDYNGWIGKDFIHPNEKGQRLIAKTLMRFIEDYGK